MSVVSHKTNRMKDRRRTMPGLSCFCAARIRIKIRNNMVNDEVTIPKGNNLYDISVSSSQD